MEEKHLKLRSRRKQQSRFLAALLERDTVKAAADQAGISESTARRWMRDDHKFMTRYNKECDLVIRHVSKRAQQLTGDAINRLKHLMKSESEDIAFKASQALLNVFLKLQELDHLQNRMDQLERMLDEESSQFPRAAIIDSRTTSSSAS